MLRFYVLCLTTLLGIIPTTGLAHTRWFTSGELASYVSTEPTAKYLAICALGASLVTIVAIWLHQHKYFGLRFMRPRADHAYDRAAATFAMVTGAFLLIAGTHHYLFAPNLTNEAGIPVVMIILQIVIGLLFLLGIATRTAAMTLCVLWSLLVYYVGPLTAVENIWVLSTGIFIAIMGNDYFSLLGRSFFKKKLEVYKPYALSILRLGTGTTLLVLGFSEKILYPEFGMNFLSMFHWNFMAELGFNFSDYFFVLAAGTVESLFGLIFVLGVVTRLNALAVTIVFMIPMFLLGPIELAGHMPHFAAIVLLLLFGNGGHFLLVRKQADDMWFK